MKGWSGLVFPFPSKEYKFRILEAGIHYFYIVEGAYFYNVLWNILNDHLRSHIFSVPNYIFHRHSLSSLSLHFNQPSQHHSEKRDFILQAPSFTLSSVLPIPSIFVIVKKLSVNEILFPSFRNNLIMVSIEIGKCELPSIDWWQFMVKSTVNQFFKRDRLCAQVIDNNQPIIFKIIMGKMYYTNILAFKRISLSIFHAHSSYIFSCLNSHSFYFIINI